MRIFDLTEIECKKAYEAGEVVWVQANPNDMSIVFFTNKTDRGFVKESKNGGRKLFKSCIDRDWAITRIKGL